MSILLETPYQAWVYLNRVVEGPSPMLQALLAEYPPEEVAHGIYHRADWLGRLRDDTAARYDWLRQEEDIAAAEEAGARLITADSPEWPTEHFEAAFGFYHNAQPDAPASFDQAAIAPHSLWVRGGGLAQLVDQSVAVIGTRAISRYGWEVTRLIVEDLAPRGWTVVSGGALGVDTAAHETALAAGGLTVAVAACGIDVNYPARNARLFDQIAATGAVVTEFPPGTTPQRHRFLTRNRLVAALAQGTVCVEAAYRSGALNTMNWTEALGKVAMAVPGPITNAGSIGCHLRIQDGRAQLITGPDGVRELLEQVGSVDVDGQLEMSFQPSITQRMSHNELKVFGSMPTQMPISAADISRECGLRLPLVIHLLVALEKQAAVRRQGGEWLRIAED
ncbi:DNA-binding protein [Corynebacterium phocae]|uniref:DNA-binding protein n=1 Tax=Corynebacterium phocae TaxID=161895 RepID=A0A1L7D2G8_9CORY|nr:DNA-processing protein DprA [Corynebacterium phocae]APT92314.1 DNA-binding protein [Corynebacterium phocae]KAA8725349.1 DNA-protecting protein DprA [Corynebacterium phocae]